MKSVRFFVIYHVFSSMSGKPVGFPLIFSKETTLSFTRRLFLLRGGDAFCKEAAFKYLF